MIPWLRRGPVRMPLFFPKPCTIRWCTGQPGFCLPFGFYFSLGYFHWVFASLLFGFLDKAGVFVGSSIAVPSVFPFFSPCLPCPFKKKKKKKNVFFLSLLLLLLLLHLLRVHSCWGFVCSFASFVDFPFFFWRVSCEKGFSPFLNFNLCTGCQGVKMYFWVLWSVWIYSL